MALSAVVLPAPFGPISPRMRPSFDPQINAVERDRCAKGFAKSACFYAGHGVSVSPSRSCVEARAAAASSSFCVRPSR